MASRSNKSARTSMAVTAGSAPKTPPARSFGAPTGYSPPARVQMGRPKPGPGTQMQRRQAIDADNAAAAAGARQMAQRKKAQPVGNQSVDPVGVSVFNAAKKIKNRGKQIDRSVDEAS